MGSTVYYPQTPAGTVLTHLEAETEDDAWSNLLVDAAHMPYKGVKGFKERGYRVFEYDVPDEEQGIAS